MAKDLNELYKKYLEIQSSGQNMADGGEVESDDSVLENLAESFKKAFSTPKPKPTPDPTLEEKYKKIRAQNQENFNNPHAQHMNKGGKVEHNLENLKALKAAFDKFLGEEGIEKYSNGGIVQKFVPEGNIQHYDDGGLVQQYKKLYPGVGDDQIAAMIASAHPAAPKAPIPGSEMMNPVPQAPQVNSGDLAQNVTGQLNQLQGMADGGVVGDEFDQEQNNPDLTPEEEAARLEELHNLQASGQANPEYVQGSEQNVTGSLPMKESDAEIPKDAGDKALEEELDNENFKAGEESDKNRDLASEDKDDSDEDSNPRQLEGMTLSKSKALAENSEFPTKDQAAGLQTSSNIQNQIDSLKSHSESDLAKAQKQRDYAILGDKLSKYGALIGAGLLKTDPSEILNLDKENSKYENLPIQKFEEQISNQQNDPNSPMSKIVKQYMQSKGLQVPDSASASDLYKVAPYLKSDQALQIGIQKVLMQQAGAGARNAASNKAKEDAVAAANKRATEHNELYKQSLVDKKENTKLAKEQKATNDQNKSLTQTQQLLESARGNPAAAQAEKDLYSVQKANSLANMYGDPNKLSPQQVNLLVSEVSKIATGGVPTGHEQEALKPGTAASHLASLWSKLTNQPTGANAGAFIKQFQDYNNALAKDAQKIIQDKYGRVIETRKNQLGDDNYKALQDQYLNRFKPTDNQIPVDADLSKLSPSELKDYIKLHGGQ